MSRQKYIHSVFTGTKYIAAFSSWRLVLTWNKRAMLVQS